MHQKAQGTNQIIHHLNCALMGSFPLLAEDENLPFSHIRQPSLSKIMNKTQKRYIQRSTFSPQKNHQKQGLPFSSDYQIFKTQTLEKSTQNPEHYLSIPMVGDSNQKIHIQNFHFIDDESIDCSFLQSKRTGKRYLQSSNNINKLQQLIRQSQQISDQKIILKGLDLLIEKENDAEESLSTGKFGTGQSVIFLEMDEQSLEEDLSFIYLCGNLQSKRETKFNFKKK